MVKCNSIIAKSQSSKASTPKWLELAIVADYSVIDFHGARVHQYLLALLNIVSLSFSFDLDNLFYNFEISLSLIILYETLRDNKKIQT